MVFSKSAVTILGTRTLRRRSGRNLIPLFFRTIRAVRMLRVQKEGFVKG